MYKKGNVFDKRVFTLKHTDYVPLYVEVDQI